MSGHHEFEQCVFGAGEDRFKIAFERRLERLFLLPLGMHGRQRLDAVEYKFQLEIHGLFGPQRAVIVKYRDAFGRRDKVGASRSGYFLHKKHDGLFGRALVP